MSERYTYNYLSDNFNFKNYKFEKCGINDRTEDRIEIVYTCDDYFDNNYEDLPGYLNELVVNYNFKTHKILDIYEVLSSCEDIEHSTDNVDVKPKRVLRLVTKGRKSYPRMPMPPLQITS
jgi:hypothetical protein